MNRRGLSKLEPKQQDALRDKPLGFEDNSLILPQHY